MPTLRCLFSSLREDKRIRINIQFIFSIRLSADVSDSPMTDRLAESLFVLKNGSSADTSQVNCPEMCRDITRTVTCCPLDPFICQHSCDSKHCDFTIDIDNRWVY